MSNFSLLLTLEESCGPDQDFYNWNVTDDTDEEAGTASEAETASEDEDAASTASEAEEEADDEPELPPAVEPVGPPGDDDVVVLCRGCWAPVAVCATGYCTACLNQMLME